MDSSFDSQKQPRSMTNVQVVVRCRPSSLEEKARGVIETVSCDTIGNEVRVASKSTGERVFSYDKVYDQRSTQKEIYDEAVEPLVQQTFRGYNTTIFAYGQTGTGKTHTMEGDLDDPESMGVIPRAMQSIFRTLDLKGDTESYVKASFLEIYNENITDLLSPNAPGESQANQQLRILEDKSKTGKGIVVQGLEEVLVKSLEDIRKVMRQAMSKRRVAATDLNERSSRSHAVFTVTVHCKEISPEGEELLRVGKINLVDLAGSECVARSGSKDARAREAGNINQSLLTLGRVITALVEKSPHIAYRDSKLTRLLQESLGGCSLTLMIATVAPSVHCMDETLSTLEYASRAKSIKNKPIANQKMSKRVAIREYVEEIERLRLELSSARAKDGVYLPLERFNQLELTNKSTSLRVEDLEALLEKRISELNDLRGQYSQTRAELKKTTLELDEEKDRLIRTRDDLKNKEIELREEKKIVEEKQAIVDAHVSVESRLLHVNDELQERLRNGKERIHLLHEKLERKSSVERENEKLSADIRLKVENKLLEMDVTIRDGRSVTFEGMDKISELLERIAKLQSEDARQFQEEQRHRFFDTSVNAIDRAYEKSMKFIEMDRNRIKKEEEENVNSFLDAHDHFLEIGRLHQETITTIQSFQNEERKAFHEDCIVPLVKEIERSQASSKNFADSLLFTADALRQATNELILDYERKMKEMQTKMEQMVQEEKTRSKKASSKALERISLLLSNMNDDSELELDKIVHFVSEETGSMKKFTFERNILVNDCLDVISESNTNWFSHEMENKQSCLQMIGENAMKIQTNANSSHEIIMEKSEETMSISQRGVSDCKVVQSRIANLTQNVYLELKDRENGLINENAMDKSSLIEINRTAIQEGKQMEERSLSLIGQARKDLTKNHSQIDEFCSKTMEIGEESRIIIENFHLKEDKPIGRTPSRLQLFDWTKERPQTSPHTKIVERVRRSRNSNGLENNENSQIHSNNHVFDIEEVGVPTTGKKAFGRQILMETTVKENLEDLSTFDSLKLQELRSACKEKGISTAGTKQTLKDRLRRASLGEICVEDGE